MSRGLSWQGWTHSSFSIACLIAVSTCCEAQQDEPFVGYVHRSQIFEYHVRDPGPLCPTLLDLLDEHARMVGRKIGVAANEIAPLRYYKFRDEADFSANAEPCASGLQACAFQDAVYSSKSLHAHELVHAYVSLGWGGTSVGLLNEGVAVALSCEPFFTLQPGERPREALQSVLSPLDWRALIYLNGEVQTGYCAAGFFVTHLAQRYGWSSIAEIFRRVPPGTTVADFEHEFARVFPLSVDQAWAEALDLVGAAPCQPDWQCTATELSEQEPANPECDDEMHRLIHLLQPADIALTFDGNGSFELVNCGTSASVAFSAEGHPEGTEVTRHLSLPAGSYALFGGTDGLPSQVEWRVCSSEAQLADGCESERLDAVELTPALGSGP